MADWAFRSFEEATIFMAEVIFNVPFTELILLLISFNDAIVFFLHQIRRCTHATA